MFIFPKYFWVILLSFFVFNFYSCGRLISLDFNTRGLTSYKKKTFNECSEIFFNENNIRYDSAKPKIEIINGKQLLEQIRYHEKTLIYIWSPRCKSKNCIDLNLLQNHCNNKRINLIVVAEYYDCSYMSKDYNLKNSIVAIDTKYYKRNFTSAYMKRFLADLNVKEEAEGFGRYLLFYNNNFERRYNNPQILFN